MYDVKNAEEVFSRLYLFRHRAKDGRNLFREKVSPKPSSKKLYNILMIYGVVRACPKLAPETLEV